MRRDRVTRRRRPPDRRPAPGVGDASGPGLVELERFSHATLDLDRQPMRVGTEPAESEPAQPMTSGRAQPLVEVFWDSLTTREQSDQLPGSVRAGRLFAPEQRDKITYEGDYRMACQTASLSTRHPSPPTRGVPFFCAWKRFRSRTSMSNFVQHTASRMTGKCPSAMRHSHASKAAIRVARSGHSLQPIAALAMIPHRIVHQRWPRRQE